MNKYNKKQKLTRVKILILFIIILIGTVSCDECHDSNGKPYKYVIFNENIWPDGSYRTTEEIIYLDNGSIRYYDEHSGWTTLSTYTIRELNCTK